MESAVQKALSRSRAVHNTAHAGALALMEKAKSMNDTLVPFDGLGQLNQFRDQGANQNRYNLYRGWVYSAVNALAMECASQPVQVGRMKKKGKQKKGPKGQKTTSARRKKYETQLSAYQRSKMPLGMRRKSATEEIEVMLDHPLLDILDKPNAIQGRWQFVYSFVANLCLTGWSFVIGAEKEDGDGMEFFSLPTTWIRPDHTNGPFAQFRIVNPQNPESDMDSEPFDRSQVGFAYLPNPADPMTALAPAQAQSRAIHIDEQIQSSQDVFFQNGMFPSVIITVGKNPHPEVAGGMRPRLSAAQRRQVYATIRKVSSGVANYGNPAIVDGLIEKIERLSATSNEMGWEKSEKTVRGRILSAFGVHPFILGEEMAGSYAQAYVVQDRFCRRANIFLDMCSQVITEFAPKLLDEADDSTLVWWEECKPVDPSMEKSLWEGARNRDDISQNEFRTFMGLPPDEDGNEAQVNKTLAPHVLAIAQAATAGGLKKEQAIAMLEAFGISSDAAKKIAGPGAPPGTPPPGQGMVPGGGAPPAQPNNAQQGKETPLEKAIAALGSAVKVLDSPTYTTFDADPIDVYSDRDIPTVQTLYVCRYLKNTKEFLAWAKEQGFTEIEDELHVTLVYSKQEVDWRKIQPEQNDLIVSGGKRQISELGEGAIVLEIESTELAARQKSLLEAGASCDYATYRPHVTITYGSDVDLTKIKPFDKDLVFGPERFARIQKD